MNEPITYQEVREFLVGPAEFVPFRVHRGFRILRDVMQYVADFARAEHTKACILLSRTNPELRARQRDQEAYYSVWGRFSSALRRLWDALRVPHLCRGPEEECDIHKARLLVRGSLRDFEIQECKRKAREHD